VSFKSRILLAEFPYSFDKLLKFSLLFYMSIQTPKAGEYYYHYKHNPEKDIVNYAYLIIGIALHSETKEKLVAYKPLYSKNYVEKHNADFNVRPLDMFVEDVTKDNQTFSRFRKMTEEEVTKLKQAMQNS
jgi:hypothetical protein